MKNHTNRGRLLSRITNLEKEADNNINNRNKVFDLTRLTNEELETLERIFTKQEEQGHITEEEQTTAELISARAVIKR